MGWGEARLPLQVEPDARVQLLSDLLVAARRREVSPTLAAEAVLKISIAIAADVAELPDHEQPMPAWLANEIDLLTR